MKHYGLSEKNISMITVDGAAKTSLESRLRPTEEEKAEDLTGDFSFKFKILWCVCHRMDVCLKNASEKSGLDKIISPIREVCKYFRRRPAALC